MDTKSEPLGKKFKEQHHHFSPKLWTTTYLTQNTSNKALINRDLKSKDKKSQNKRPKCVSKWDELPDLLLEEIFRRLSIRERYYASLVCKSWNRAFYFPYVWSEFTLEDSTLTRARFNYYQGWQYVLDHMRSQMCLTQVGKHFKRLTFAPMLNFFNLYEFMNMISWYIEQKNNPAIREKNIGAKVSTLRFTFPCNMDNKEEDEHLENMRLFGTGGKLLGALKRLMSNLKQLKRLELIDLMLDYQEAQHLLDEVCDLCCTTMQVLVLINTTKMQYPLLHLGVFLNLKILYISPQNLGDDVVELLGYTHLEQLHIYQNRYTPDFVVNMVSPKTWKSCRANNPDLRVHLEIATMKPKQLILWPSAPVGSILYDSPHVGIDLHEIVTILQYYRNDLYVYGHRSLPRGYRSKSFCDRVDESLAMLARECLNLRTLIISERVSTATVLLIASTCSSLKKLYVRRNAVIKKFDWPMNPTWTPDFFAWLKYSSRTYEDTEKEVSELLGCSWVMLSDKSFQKLYVNLYDK